MQRMITCLCTLFCASCTQRELPSDGLVAIGGLDARSSLGFSAAELEGLGPYAGTLSWHGQEVDMQVVPSNGTTAITIMLSLQEGTVYEAPSCEDRRIGNAPCGGYIEAPAELSFETADGALRESGAGYIRASTRGEWLASLWTHELVGSFEYRGEDVPEYSFGASRAANDGVEGWFSLTFYEGDANSGSGWGTGVASWEGEPAGE